MVKLLLSQHILSPSRRFFFAFSSRNCQSFSKTTGKVSDWKVLRSISSHALDAINAKTEQLNYQQMSTDGYNFGPYKISTEEVFYTTELSFAFVNLRPVVPGHVLVCPRRQVNRFSELTADEVTDMWLSAQKVGNQLERYHKASSLTLTIQDGPHSGQTVPHVHVHILPRKPGDFERSDEIYDAIDEKEKELKKNLDLDKERTDRSKEEMAQEAEEYRALFV